VGWGHWRVQRQVYVQSDCAARRGLRHSRKSYSCDLPQFLPPAPALPIRGNKACPMIARELVPVLDYADQVRRGLSVRPKTLPCKLFYDQRGSALFEQITELPEYYLTRTELEILRENSREIVQAAGCPVSVIELGAGTATKT